MTTATKKAILQLKVTLQDEALESWQGLSKMFKGANTPSIVRMALINYYGQIKGSKASKKKNNIQIAKQIAEEGKQMNIPEDQIDDIMADYWEQEIQPGLNTFLTEREAKTN